jgi:hypothetical protein
MKVKVRLVTLLVVMAWRSADSSHYQLDSTLRSTYAGEWPI